MLLLPHPAPPPPDDKQLSLQTHLRHDQTARLKRLLPSEMAFMSQLSAANPKLSCFSFALSQRDSSKHSTLAGATTGVALV